MSEDEDEFDNMPDDFADIQGVDWAQILAGPSGLNPTSTEESHVLETIPARPTSPNSDYFDDYDTFDPSLMAELDRIEEELAEAPQHPNGGGGVVPQTHTSSLEEPSHYFSAPTTHPQKKRNADPQSGEDIPSVFFKKQRLDDASYLPSPKGKGKMKANDDLLRRVLSAYEDEITCPICCDFFVLAHISNPCGHSFCGSCGQQCLQNNKSCPVCRTHLDKAAPMIPNITIDNIVEKHIQALALSGDQDWGPGGFKAADWHKRKQTWRNDAREREKTRRTGSSLPPVIDLEVIHIQPTWSHIEHVPEINWASQDISDIELIPRPIRRRRGRLRVSGPTVG